MSARHRVLQPPTFGLERRQGVDQSWHGRGLGGDLLREALRRTLAASDQIGIRAFVVDASADNAAGFYRRYGFELSRATVSPLWSRRPRRGRSSAKSTILS